MTSPRPLSRARVYGADIVKTPGTLGGAPRIRGRRIGVEHVVGYFMGGWSFARIAAELRVDVRLVEQAVRYAWRNGTWVWRRNGTGVWKESK